MTAEQVQEASKKRAVNLRKKPNEIEKKLILFNFSK